jgi:hypothetical protein
MSMFRVSCHIGVMNSTPGGVVRSNSATGAIRHEIENEGTRTIRRIACDYAPGILQDSKLQ